MEILRNMFRRKLRTLLTILGIVIGIYAFTVMGAMSEKMNLMIEGGVRFVGGQIVVGAKGGSFGQMITGSLISKDLADKVKKVKGIKATQKRVVMLLKESSGEITLGMPNLLEGWELDTGFKFANDVKINIHQGRDLKPDDSKKAVVGHDIAKDENLQVGDYYKIRDKKFKVVGITEKMMTGPDKIVFIPLKDSQRIMIDSQPFLQNLEKKSKEAKKMGKKQPREFSVEDANNSLAISWKKGQDPEKLAKRIEKEVDGVFALSPKKGAESFRNASVIINLIIMGSALIAVIVGGLSVINTMVVSVNERVKEIGVKRAVGAKTYHILTDYILEAATIGLVGGLIGLGLAVLTVELVNANTIKKGVEIFAVTPRLATTSITFALALGVLAGIYPAIHASRLNPVKALRS